MEPGESETAWRMKAQMAAKEARGNAKLLQGAASLVGAASTMFLALAPTSLILIAIILVAATVTVAVGVKFTMSAPAIKWGLAGAVPAFLLVLFYAFTAFIFSGPP